MKVLLAGASGFLGRALLSDLAEHGHETTRLVRGEPAGPDEVRWDPSSGVLDASIIRGFDAVIGLSGAGIGDKRWTPAYKQTLRDSRIQPTAALATAIAALDVHERPDVFVSASAVGFYGSRGDEILTEESEAGAGFLAQLVIDWEAAAAPAVDAGVRVVFLRTGLVLAATGGLLKKLLPLFKLGIGGKLGSGRQYQPWISLADEIGAIRHILESSNISGPVNLSSPNPVRNSELGRVIAAAVHRPALVPNPAFALRAALGEFADEGVLASQRSVPDALIASGYQFEHPDLASAMDWAIRH
ncbi:MAG: hypothetical protein JWM76_889 [Pseudonocardiales bacterium]|nr:hypothetical protein [Pseudonocardiales bacterium]